MQHRVRSAVSFLRFQLGDAERRFTPRTSLYLSVLTITHAVAGDLLALLDMPSLAVALKKLVLAYRKFGDYDGFLKVYAVAVDPSCAYDRKR
jgi:hypothetical protein